MVRVFLKNMGSGKEFEVIGRDKEAGTITLKGDYAQFTEKFDKDRLKEAGYEMVTREDGSETIATPSAQAEMTPPEEEDEGDFAEFGEPGDEDE